MRRLPLTPKQQRITIGVFIACLVILLISWRLGTVPSGINPLEKQLLDSVNGAEWFSATLLKNLLYLVPVKTILGMTTGEQTLLVLRVINVLYALVSLALYYLLARNWWSRTIAVAGTALLASSAWFLVTIRLIDPGILAVVWLPLLLLIFLKLKHESKWWQIIAAGGVSGLAFYVSPVLAWLSIALIATALHYSIRLNRGRIASGWLVFFVGFTLSIVPLMAGVIREPVFGLHILGITQLNTPAEILNQAVLLVKSVLFETESSLYVPGLPLLDIATFTLALYGFLRALTTLKLGRSTPVLFVLAVSVLITILTGHQASIYAYLLPVAYLLLARGLNQFMSEWYKRFPRNPGARLVGATALVLLVGLISLYNIRVFYVAWSRNNQIQSYFNNQA